MINFGKPDRAVDSFMNSYTFHINLYDLFFTGAIFAGAIFALLLWFGKNNNRAANRFLSLALAFVLSTWLGSYWAGFGTMAGLYLLVAIIIKLAKGKIQKPLIDMFIKKFFE